MIIIATTYTARDGTRHTVSGEHESGTWRELRLNTRPIRDVSDLPEEARSALEGAAERLGRRA